MNKEIIDELRSQLKRGDIAIIATRSGHSVQFVSNVLHHRQKDDRVICITIDLINERKEYIKDLEKRAKQAIKR